ncbi:MAG TPA: cytochrome c-type biogenesis protein CcmH [Ktedonobacteraceae bacterium]|jgi:cytochrome c-type biogenesis protein CcmH
MMQKRSLLLVLAAIMLAAAVWTTTGLFSARNQTLDQRVQAVASQLKCPVCQNESVASSPNWMAQQMRNTIRQQLQEGKSEQDIIQYFQQRYGDSIVWTPQWQGVGMLAWLVPIVLLLLGLLLVYFTVRDWHALAVASTAQQKSEKEEEQAWDDEELQRYRQQLEQELAEEDSLFEKYGMESR